MTIWWLSDDYLIVWLHPYLPTYIEFVKKQISINSKYDLIFIDGGHEYKTVKNDFQIACKNINDVLFIFHEKKSPKKKILEYISKITGQNIINFKCILLKKFPRTLNGKINYKKL